VLGVLQGFWIKEAVQHGGGFRQITDRQALFEAGFDEGFEKGNVILVMLDAFWLADR
jgi:hypothetical protein